MIKAIRMNGSSEKISEELRTTVAIIVYAVIAGSAFLFTKEASATIPAATLTAFRLTIGSLGLISSFSLMFGVQKLYFTIRYELFGTSNSSLRVCVVGLLNTVIPYTLYAVASENGIDVSVQAIMSGLSPVFVALLSYLHIPDAEPLCRQLKVVGLVLCISGGCLVTLHDEITEGSMSASSTVGVLAQLIAVVSKSSAAIVAEHTFKYHPIRSMPTSTTTNNNVMILNDEEHTNSDEDEAAEAEDDRRMKSPGFALGQACIGALVAIPLAILWDFLLVPSRGLPLQQSNFDWVKVIAPILYLGLISSCFVYYLQFYIVKKAGGLRQIVTVDSLTPVVGVVEGSLLNCDFCGVQPLSMGLSITGAAMCVCGVSLFQYDAFRLAKQSRDPTDHSPSIPSWLLPVSEEACGYKNFDH